MGHPLGDVVTAAGQGDLPLPLYIVFVVVGLLIGAVLVTLLVTALVTSRPSTMAQPAREGWLGYRVPRLPARYADVVAHLPVAVKRAAETEARQARAGLGMREFPAGPVEHPELDYGGAGFAATETRMPVVFLDAGRLSLLEATRDAGKRAVLVTDEVCALTPALAAVCQEPDAAWVVPSAAGQRTASPAAGSPASATC